MEIPRPRLAEPIRARLAGGAVVIEADAGFGKSIALREALDGRAAAWMALSRAERDPGRLLLKLVQAVERAIPGAAADTERLLARGGLDPVDARQAAGALIARLRSLLVDPLAIVVDDAESLEGATEAVGIVADLVAAAGGPLGVAVAARKLPDGAVPPGVAPLRVGPGELAFRPEEAAALLEARLGRRPSEEELDAVLEATEGWPLGVALGDPGAGSPPAGAPGSREAALAYLDEALLGTLDPEVRDALVTSSIAPVIDELTVRALELPSGLTSAARPVGLFLRPDGDGGMAHHPFVREVLSARLARERTPGEVRELHGRLAEALTGAGRIEEAVEHWLAAERWPEAAGTIALAGAKAVTSAPATVARWIEALPEPARSEPPLLVLAGRLALGDGANDRAEQLARAAEAAFGAREDEGGRWLARFALADALFSRGRREDLAQAAELADELETPGAQASPFAPAVGMAAAAALARLGRFAAAEQLYAAAAAHPAGEELRTAEPGFAAFYLDLPAGRLDAALDRIQSAIAAVEAGDDRFGRLVYLLGFLCVIHEERGEDDAAIAAARRAEELAAARGLGDYLGAGARAFIAGAHARAGRIAEAELELERAGGVTRPWRGWREYDFDLTRAAIAVARGDASGALRACERALAMAAADPYPELARATALGVPVLVDAGQPARARRALDAALDARPEGFSGARLRALRAWLSAREGSPGSLDDLRQAWEEAGDQVHHLLRREWPRLGDLLPPALAEGALDAGEVVAAIEAARPGGAALLPLLEHPVAEVRRAAALPAATSGHPAALTRLTALTSDPDPAVARAAVAATSGVRADPPPLAIRTLGGFAVRRGAWIADEAAWGRKIAERLVRFLVVHRDAPVPEDVIFEAFWPGRSAASARRSLQVALSCARSALDPPGAPASVIESSDRAYQLVLRERDSVDAQEFETAARAALAETGEARIALLRRADALWQGDPLPDNAYDDWALGWREHLLDVRVEVLAALADAHEAAGDRAGTIVAARRLVEADPLNEAGHRALIRAYARGGRRGPALRQFLECRRRLVDELGIEPSAETAELQRRVLAGEPV